LRSSYHPADERTDAELAGTAKDSVRWNKLVPHELTSVTAANGRLTLTGQVPIATRAMQPTTLSILWSV
jgi:osmotically-inducible protein OsmY